MKKILAIVVIGMFLLTGLGVLSVAGIQIETNDESIATIKGKVLDKNGVNYVANIEIRMGEDPETAEYVKAPLTGEYGYYTIELEADEEGTTYQVRAIKFAILGRDDSSEWEEITVFPGETYTLDDLVLPNTPKGKSKSVVHPLMEFLLQLFPILRNIQNL